MTNLISLFDEKLDKYDAAVVSHDGKAIHITINKCGFKLSTEDATTLAVDLFELLGILK